MFSTGIARLEELHTILIKRQRMQHPDGLAVVVAGQRLAESAGHACCSKHPAVCLGSLSLSRHVCYSVFPAGRLSVQLFFLHECV